VRFLAELTMMDRGTCKCVRNASQLGNEAGLAGRMRIEWLDDVGNRRSEAEPDR
jgi:hypothetical protein